MVHRAESISRPFSLLKIPTGQYALLTGHVALQVKQDKLCICNVNIPACVVACQWRREGMTGGKKQTNNTFLKKTFK